MTEVTRNNCAEVIPEIIGKLQECTFLAMDAEYTGLLSPSPSYRNSLFDSVDERYQKLKSGFGSFQISQFGLAIFKRCWERNEYFVDVYNIYLYPVAFDDFVERDVIPCQISSFNFLASKNFDFNKFIKEGTPSLRKDQRIQLNDYLKANPMFMRWMEHRDKAYFPQFLDTVTEDDRKVIIHHLTGFSKVIHAISELHKPIIGHNMFMDLILIYKQFYEDLPPSYKEFKVRIHELFPELYDTKHIAASLRRDLLKRNSSSQELDSLFNTSLFPLYLNTFKVRALFAPIITLVNDAKERYKNELIAGIEENLECVTEAHCHEAGFDATVTGAVFLQLAHIAASRDEKFLIRRMFPPTVAETLSSLRFWKNSVNLVRAPICFINLVGEDPPIDKPNWIRVEGNPRKGKALNLPWLKKHLPKFGDIEIVQINEQAVLLASAAWSSARNIWNSLEEEGYVLSAQEFPSNSFDWFPMASGILLGTIGLISCVVLPLRKWISYSS